MLTLCFTSSCFARSFFFPSFLIVSLFLLLLLLWRRSSHPLCVIRVTVLLQFFLLLFSISFCIRYFGHCGARRVNPFGPMINDRFLFYFLLFCTDFN